MVEPSPVLTTTVLNSFHLGCALLLWEVFGQTVGKAGLAEAFDVMRGKVKGPVQSFCLPSSLLALQIIKSHSVELNEASKFIHFPQRG